MLENRVGNTGASMKPTTLRTQSISGLARVVALTLLVACGQAAPQQPAARPPTAAPAPASGAAAAPPASAPQPSSEGDWRSTWERTLEAAKQEGRVVVYSTPSAGHRNGLLKFQEAYPDISLELS